MNKKDLEKIIKYGLDLGNDYVELYFEKTQEFLMVLREEFVEKCGDLLTDGVGIRLYSGDNSLFSCTSDISVENIIKIIDELSLKKEQLNRPFKLGALKKIRKKKIV